uniref:GHMP_kinases_C domain-containing protein n=1 Tax=Heterorhabditis bacteriophora TaxID=37862 RepID=A0A1I7XU43_HETBA
MGVGSWRDVSHELIQSLPGLNDQDMVENATHIVDEIERTIKASKALLDNNIIQFGKLMLESHVSLRDRYRVSCLELDQLVDLAMECEGVFGSRMTGGGFGGCTVTLVKKDKVGALKEYIKSKYTGGTLSFYECEPVGGASTIGLAYLRHTK